MPLKARTLEGNRECMLSVMLAKYPRDREILQHRAFSIVKGQGIPVENIVRLPKGKGPDPRNWGAISTRTSEVDSDTQRVALASWKATQEWARNNMSSQGDSDAVSFFVKDDNCTRPSTSQPEAPTAANENIHDLSHNEIRAELVQRQRNTKEGKRKPEHPS